MLANGNIVEESKKYAKAQGVTISFDLASFNAVDRFKDSIPHLLLHYVDIVFANQDEAFALTSCFNEESCKMMLNYCKTAVVLDAANGCIVGSQDGIFRKKPSEVAVVDTTGAGDLFASGFLYGH